MEEYDKLLAQQKAVLRAGILDLVMEYLDSLSEEKRTEFIHDLPYCLVCGRKREGQCYCMADD